MGKREINLFTDEEPWRAKFNVWIIVIGLTLFFVVTIVMAKMGAGLFLTLFVGLICIGIPAFLIHNNNAAYNAVRTQKCIEDLVQKYGDYAIKIDADCIDNMILLFPIAQVIVIQGMKFQFSEIIDFSLNEMASYKTTTSTSSMLGRGLVGGVMFGGIGALAGANSASSKTVKETAQYDFNIIIDDFSNPNFRCIFYQEDKAKTLYSILKLIIDKNQTKDKG